MKSAFTTDTSNRYVQQMFGKLLDLVAAVEAHLLGTSLFRWRWLRIVQHLTLLPLAFVWLGIGQMFKSAPTWLFTAFVCLLLGGIMTQYLGIARTPMSGYLMDIAMIVPLLMVLFALPSVYGTSGVTSETVEFIVEYLEARNFSTNSDIPFLTKSVKPMEERAKRRLTAFKWSMSIPWAVFLYYLSLSLDPSMHTEQQLIAYNFYSSILLLVSFATYAVVSGYEAAIDMLFRSIEFGCNAYCHRIETRAESEDKNEAGLPNDSGALGQPT